MYLMALVTQVKKQLAGAVSGSPDTVTSSSTGKYTLIPGTLAENHGGPHQMSQTPMVRARRAHG